MIPRFILPSFWTRRSRKLATRPDRVDERLMRAARADNAADRGQADLAPDRARAVFEAALLFAHAEPIQTASGGGRAMARGPRLRRVATWGVAATVTMGVAVAAWQAQETPPAMRKVASVTREANAPYVANGEARDNGVRLVAAAPSPLFKSIGLGARAQAVPAIADALAIPRAAPNAAIRAVRPDTQNDHREANRLVAAAPLPRAATRHDEPRGGDNLATGAPNVTYCGVEFPATFSTVTDEEIVATAENDNSDDAAAANVMVDNASGALDPTASSQVSAAALSLPVRAQGADAHLVANAVQGPDAPLALGGDEPRFTLSVSHSAAGPVAATNEAVSVAVAGDNGAARPPWGFAVSARRIASGDKETPGYAEASQVRDEDMDATVADSVLPRAIWRRCVVRGTDAPRVTVARVAPDQ